MEWQDISTAPRDGSTILGWHPEWGYAFTSFKYYRFNECFLNSEVEPTHWMPLPTPPEVQSDE